MGINRVNQPINAGIIIKVSIYKEIIAVPPRFSLLSAFPSLPIKEFSPHSYTFFQESTCISPICLLLQYVHDWHDDSNISMPQGPILSNTKRLSHPTRHEI